MISSITGRSETKPVLLVFPFGLLSHYLRCLMLCRHLKEYFDIRFLDNSAYNAFIGQEGFETFECSSLDPVKAIEGVKNFDFSWLEKGEMKRLLDDQIRVIEELRPLGILGDYAPTLKMASEYTNTCFISLMNGYMSKYFAGSRQISKNHPAYRLINHLPPKFAAALTRFGESRAFAQLHIPFNEIRSEYGLATYNSYLDELEGDINFVCDLPEIFPQEKLPSHYHIIGPLYYDGVYPENITGPVAQPAIGSSKKTILVSMGSSGNWDNVAFLNNREFEAFNVIVVGNHDNKLGGAHIVSVPFVGLHDEFRKADLVICHGGNGTLYQALYYGIPTLVSTNHCEQEWNLEAFSERRAAWALPEGATVSQIKTLIENLIDSKATRSIANLSSLVRDWQGRLPQVVNDILSPNDVLEEIGLEQPVHAARIA